MLESSSPCVLIVPSLEARISCGVALPFCVVARHVHEIPGIVPCLKACPLYSFHAWKLVPSCLDRPIFRGSYFWRSSSSFLRSSSSCAWDSWNRPIHEGLSSLFFSCLKTRPPLVSWYVPFLEAYCISVGGGSSFCLLARHLPSWNRPRSAGGYRNPTIKSKIRILFYI
jgi:hypothetical protein